VDAAERTASSCRSGLGGRLRARYAGPRLQVAAGWTAGLYTRGKQPAQFQDFQAWSEPADDQLPVRSPNARQQTCEESLSVGWGGTDEFGDLTGF